jgi:hypothetical protein
MTDDVQTTEHEELVEQELEREELERKIDRSWMLRFETMLSRRSRAFVIIMGLLLLALVGLIDAVTGAFAVEVFYLVPIALVTFARGRWVGLWMAGVASISWGIVEVAQKVTTVDQSITYWNGLTRFYGYAAIVLLIAPMRQAMVMQRELAEREADDADQLRAMNELRDVALRTELDDEGEVSHETEVPEGEELMDALSALDRDTTGQRYGRPPA